MKILRYFLVVLLLACIIRAAGSDALSPNKPLELFNGKDLTGWVVFSPKSAPGEVVWSVREGLLHCVGQPKGYLRTEQAYNQYKLTVEWKFLKPGNTGVMVHINGEDKIWANCVECQGAHNRQGDFWFQGGSKCKEPFENGKNYIAMKVPSAEKPVGEWNTYVVICRGDTVTIIVNGTEMNKATECSTSSGWIGLQSEGSELLVRRVRIEPLN